MDLLLMSEDQPCAMPNAKCAPQFPTKPISAQHAYTPVPAPAITSTLHVSTLPSASPPQLQPITTPPLPSHKLPLILTPSTLLLLKGRSTRPEHASDQQGSGIPPPLLLPLPPPCPSPLPHPPLPRLLFGIMSAGTMILDGATEAPARKPCGPDFKGRSRR
jgi:hypothetical protein